MPFGISREIDVGDFEGVEHVLEPPDVFGIGVAADYTVQRLYAPTPEEIHHLGTGLGFPDVEEVALAAGLDEHPVALPHVYKAHDQRARGGWEVTGVGRTPQLLEAARRSNRAMGRAGTNLYKVRCGPLYSRPSAGVRRSIHSSASVRESSPRGLPIRLSRRATPFSPRSSSARVLSRSIWLLRAF